MDEQLPLADGIALQAVKDRGKRMLVTLSDDVNGVSDVRLHGTWDDWEATLRQRLEDGEVWSPASVHSNEAWSMYPVRDDLSFLLVSIPENVEVPDARIECSGGTIGMRWGRSHPSSLRTHLEGLNDVNVRLDVAEQAGERLGQVHAAISLVKRERPNERLWNARLKSLEEWTTSKTLWRAPHTLHTHTTIDLGPITLDSMAWSSEGPGVIRPALHHPAYGAFGEVRRPALASLASMLLDLEAQLELFDMSNEQRVAAKSRFLAGWRRSAPLDWSSRASFDAHRGGLAIWLYESALLDRWLALDGMPAHKGWSTHWLKGISTIQRKMFHSRTFAAGALLGRWGAPLSILAYFWVSIPFWQSVLGALGAGVLWAVSNTIYRLRAPDPTWTGILMPPLPLEAGGSA